MTKREKIRLELADVFARQLGLQYPIQCLRIVDLIEALIENKIGEGPYADRNPKTVVPGNPTGVPV